MTRDSAAPIETSIERANISFDAALQRTLSNASNDLSGLPIGASAWWVARASKLREHRPLIIICPESETVQRLEDSLRFFDPDCRTQDLLRYPALDTSPFLEVMPDWRAEMERLRTLHYVSQGMQWRYLIVSARAMLQKVVPLPALKATTLSLHSEGKLDRERLIKGLSEAGYLRVPLVEDPGTFAVRGAIIDLFPPHTAQPIRIELDDQQVLSLHFFDPDRQQTTEILDHIEIPPVRDIVLSTETLAEAKKNLRSLCDDFSYPTTKTNALLQQLDRGSSFLELRAFAPAFYGKLASLFDYVPQIPKIWYDPAAIQNAISDELEVARRDRDARLAHNKPSFVLSEHFLDEEQAIELWQETPRFAIHRVAITSEAGSDEPFEPSGKDDLLRLGAEDQHPLTTELRRHRQQHAGSAGLDPLIRHIREWIEGGLQTFLVTRNRTQADRLQALLRDYGLETQLHLEPPNFKNVKQSVPHITVGSLRDGFLLAEEAVVFVSEEEIFGTRARQRLNRRTEERKAKRFLEDLRQLRSGDFVVHHDHGVGCFIGLEHKALAQSSMDRLHGKKPKEIEVVVIEYAGGDRLFLPVTRLGALQRFSAKEGHRPKLDRLGGTTFATKKGKARQAARQMAEELLRVYAQRRALERPAFASPDRLYAEFEATFQFEETRDQAKAIDDVLRDLESVTPMDRLICGDVGFGKTEIAIRAAFHVAMSGRQVAVLCPTTVLAQQHFKSFQERFHDYPINVKVLSRFVGTKEQRQTIAGLKDGSVDLVIGTHRMLSKDVHFKHLGLLVVDEEQRFGVMHKERIKKLRANVDVLTLSATPIPRTLQLAIGGIRDLSLIATAPVDRRAIRTFLCRWDEHLIREAIGRELSRGGQVFFVYNRIDGLYERAQRLQDLVPEARIAVAHGKMREGALERTMTDFVEGAYDILCSTAIVESGLDIPRANTILIDRADRFGLAQLYQLRGRVGRSAQRAYCYLITPAASELSEDARLRLEAIERFADLGAGFQVASLDMELRGAGDLLGAEQSGNVSLVGFDMFVRMLEEAVHHLEGKEHLSDIDPEISVDIEHYLPDDYIDDVGLRLSIYQRFVNADDESSVQEIAKEMEERFGNAPEAARNFVRVMSLKPLLKRLRITGCEARQKSVTLYLQSDTPIQPAQLMPLISSDKSPWRLSPDMKLSYTHPDPDAIIDPADATRDILVTLQGLCQKSESLQNNPP